MRLLVLGKSHISQIFALCNLLAILFHYSDLPSANFGQFYFISMISWKFFAQTIALMK